MQRSSLICLSTVDWGFLWGRHQELMSRFAADGVSVLYVEPLGIRSARLEDWPRIVERLHNRVRAGHRGWRSPIPNLYIHSPLALPVQGPRWAERFNGWVLSRSLKSLIRQLGMPRPILWVFYATQTALDLAAAVDHRLLIYDCVDDVAHNLKGVTANYRELERKLLGQADVVFATSAALARERGHLNPNVYHIPPGVHPERFSRSRPKPKDIAAIRHPRIGFFGGVDERIDQDLISYVAKARPEWSFVFIGNIRTDTSTLQQHPNIHFLGQKGVEQLAPYLHALDVLLIPYVINRYTEHIYPNKAFECMAVGKPTVATPLPELRQLEGLVKFARTPDDFLAALEAGLAEDDPRLVTRRRRLARENTWETRYSQVLEHIETVSKDSAFGLNSSFSVRASGRAEGETR